jgi:hypothetical protein
MAGYRDCDGIPTVPPPTEQEIRRACERIQAGWSEQQRRKRAGTPEKRWVVPEVSVLSRFGAFDERVEDADDAAAEVILDGER